MLLSVLGWPEHGLLGPRGLGTDGLGFLPSSGHRSPVTCAPWPVTLRTATLGGREDGRPGLEMKGGQGILTA